MIFPSRDEAAEVMHPGKEPLHFPALSIAAQLAAILTPAAITSVRRNHFDSVVFSEFGVERVRVVGLVADDACGEFVEKASGKNLFHKLALGWRSALHRHGERKTVISGDSDDLRPLAAAGGADGKAPFLALANVASTNASSRFSRPRSCRCRASVFSASSSFPLRIHCWKRRWQVWYGGYFSGSSRHCAPVPSTQNTPFSTARVSCHGRPRLPGRSEERERIPCCVLQNVKLHSSSSVDRRGLSASEPYHVTPARISGISEIFRTIAYSHPPRLRSGLSLFSALTASTQRCAALCLISASWS